MCSFKWEIRRKNIFCRRRRSSIDGSGGGYHARARLHPRGRRPAAYHTLRMWSTTRGSKAIATRLSWLHLDLKNTSSINQEQLRNENITIKTTNNTASPTAAEHWVVHEDDEMRCYYIDVITLVWIYPAYIHTNVITLVWIYAGNRLLNE